MASKTKTVKKTVKKVKVAGKKSISSSDLRVSGAKSCTVKFTRIDNQAVVLVDGNEVWRRSYEGDPQLDANANSHTVKLKPKTSILLSILCINWGGPSHLEGFIELGGQWGNKIFSHYDQTDENGLSFLKTYRIKN